jgi:hypothetical protein
MNRLAALVLAFATLAVPVLASAAPAQAPAARHEKNDKKFPMKAEDFKKHAENMISKSRTRMEEHITKKSVPDDKAKEIRAKFDAGVALVQKEVERVCADGTVTKDEAREVHTAMKALHAGGHGHKKSAKK